MVLLRWARPGRPAQPWAERIAPGSAVVLRLPCQGRHLAPRHRREAPAAGPGRRLAATRAELRQRAHPQAAYRPEGQALVSRPGLVLRREQASMLHRDVRAAASGCRRLVTVSPLERALRRELAILQPVARPGVPAAAHPGVQPAARRACSREPASRSAQASGLVTQSVQARRSGQARQVVPAALRAKAKASPSGGLEALLRAGPVASAPGVRRTVPEAAYAAARQEAALVSGELQAAVASAHAAAELRREAAWEPDVLQAVPEGAVSAHAAVAPQPAAAKAASVRQPAEVAAAEPDGPQVEAEAALSGAAVRRRAAARRVDGAVQPRAAVRPGARALQAARPLAVPSEAASVFRQGQSLVAGPARRRAAAHFAHAMRSLRIASRSEPSLQAARDEGWSWW